MKKTTLLFLIFTFLLTSCGIHFKTGNRNRKNLPDAVLGDFQYTSASDSGYREWEIKAEQAKMFDKKHKIMLYNMTMSFFGPKNTVDSFLSADFGYVDQATLNVYAQGNVKILSEKQATMMTDKVYWDNKKKIFYSESNDLVTLIRGHTTLKGYDMTADSRLKQIQINRVVASVEK